MSDQITDYKLTDKILFKYKFLKIILFEKIYL